MDTTAVDVTVGAEALPDHTQLPDEDEVAVLRRADHGASSVRRRENDLFSLRREVLERRVPEVEAGQRVTAALSAENRVGEIVPERPGLLDLGAAVDRAVATFESLNDRGCRAEHVDHDPDGNARRLPRCKGDVDVHRADVTG